MAWIRMTGGTPSESTKYIIKNGVLQDGYTDAVSGGMNPSRTTSGGARVWSQGSTQIYAPNCFYVTAPIDVTNFSKAIIQVTTNSVGVNPTNVPYNNKYVGFALSTSASEYIQSFAASKTLSPIVGSITTYEIDLANLTGNYYFCANVNGNQTVGTLSLFNVYLVK